MKVDIRRILLSKIFLVPIAVLVLYTLTGFFLAPLPVRWALSKYARETLRCGLGVGEVHINPFLLTFEASDFTLAEADGTPLAGFSRLFMDVRLSKLFQQGARIKELRVERPSLQVTIEPDGGLNLARLAPSSGEPQPAQSEPVRMFFENLVVQGGEVTITDNRRSPSSTLAIRAINLAFQNLSTFQDQPATCVLTADNPSGETFRWEGDISLAPLRSSGKVALTGIRTSTLWEFVRDRVNLEPPTGHFEIHTDYRFEAGDPEFQFLLDGLRLKVADLSLQLASTEKTLLKLDQIELEGAHLDLAAREFVLGKLLMAGGALDLQIDPAGQINLQRMAGKKTPAVEKDATLPGIPGQNDVLMETAGQNGAPQESVGEKAAPTTSDASPWKLNADSIDIRNIALALADLRRSAVCNTQIGDLGVHIKAAVELGPQRTRVAIEDFAAGLKSIQLTSAQAPQAPLRINARIADLGLRFNAALEAGSEPTQLTVQDFSSELKSVQLTAPRAPQPLFASEKVALEGGQFDLAARSLTLSRIALSNGHADVSRNRAGNLNWMELLGEQPDTPTASAPQPPPAGQPSWKYLLKAVEISGFRSAFSDLAAVPDKPLYSLQGLNVRIRDTDGHSPMGVELEFQLDQGGTAALRGTFDPAARSLNAEVNLNGLNLTPLQPFLEPFVTLTLQSAQVATRGNLRLGLAERGTQLIYEGGFDLNKFQLLEPASSDIFLGWSGLQIPKLKLTLAPDRLDVSEIRLTKPVGKLIIAEDGSVNLAKVLKTPPPSENAPAPTQPAPAQVGEPFAFYLGKLRVEDGDWLFGDLSLTPKFMARIHNLKGLVSGLSSARDSRALIRLDGRVDQYGSAKITGEINLFDPKRATEVEMVFRNVEMTSLTPYSGRFTGRRINSGKLSADLKYRIQDNKLAGENRIIVDNLQLGERVESPHAANLPLDLAVALMQDSGGRIDIGLPVSGDLSDPKFSFGHLIGKALANVVTKVVTAPFRALGGLLGGDGKQAENVEFDPGKAELLPPEKEKLKKLADALQKRPQLQLVVQGRYSTEADGYEMQALNVQRAVAGLLGSKLAPEEQPEPLDFADGKTRHALDELFTERFGAAALEELKHSVELDAVAPRESETEQPKQGKTAAAGRWSKLTRALKLDRILRPEESARESASLAAAQYARLVASEPLPEEQLIALAESRARAIVAELQDEDGIPAKRLAIKQPEPLADGARPSATLSLDTLNESG